MGVVLCRRGHARRTGALSLECRLTHQSAAIRKFPQCSSIPPRKPLPAFAGLRLIALGQFWAMRDGSPGKYGTPGKEESVRCSFQLPIVASNRILSAEGPPMAHFLEDASCEGLFQIGP